MVTVIPIVIVVAVRAVREIVVRAAPNVVARRHAVSLLLKKLC